MKPREQNDQNKRQAKGLARWDWIKAYLKPALRYAGITSRDFDKMILGGDEHIRKEEVAATQPIAGTGISINGIPYEVTGLEDLSTLDGFICITFDFEPIAIEIDATSTPPSFIFSGNINIISGPNWTLGDEFNVRASLGTDGSILSYGRVIIPVAYQENQSVEVFIQSSINLQTFGTLGIDFFLT